MLKENKKFIPDIRVNIFLAFVGSVVVLVYKNEITFTIAFVISLIFIMIQEEYKKVLKFISAFLLLFLLSNITIGITKLQTLWLLSTIARHILIPLSFLSGISERPTGMIIEVFHRLHLPKSFAISSIVLMRFMPTIKYELNAIRGALKFRGIGVSVFSTIIHLPRNFYLTLIPLLIRTVRISDEITVAALTRGVGLDNNIVSFSEVKWTNRDSIAITVLSVIFIALKVIEIKWGWKF